MTEARPRSGRRAFTLIELLVVIGIIVLLISILIPVVGKVRDKAAAATVKAQLNGIESAINAYQMAFSAFPGPLASGQIGLNVNSGVTVVSTAGGGTLQGVTGAENLVLGLLGGLKPNAANNGFEFDPAIVSRGPRSLNTRRPGSPAKAYLEGAPITPPPSPRFPGSKQGEFNDDAGDAVDSLVPELVDRFSDPLPILYFRAQKGARGVVSINGNDDGTPVFPTLPDGNLEQTQYNLDDNLGYTQGNGNDSIGVGKRIGVKDYKNFNSATPTSSFRPHGLQSVNSGRTMNKSDTANFEYPYDAFPYFQNRSSPPSDPTQPNATGTPQQKDGFILISAGLDRVYGTADDIVNFTENVAQ